MGNLNIATTAPQTSAVSGAASTNVSSTEPVIPEHIKELFGKPALLAGESSGQYEHLMKELALCINPKNTLEWLWLKDVVDCSYDILRYQRFKGAVAGLGRRRAVRNVVSKVVHENNHSKHLNRLTDGYFTDPKVRDELKGLMKQVGLTEDCIDAQALTDVSADVSKIDTLQGSALSRRNAALRELDRSRTQFLVPPKPSGETIEVEALEDVEETKSSEAVMEVKAAEKRSRA